MKILFVKLGALGDVINTFPLAAVLQEHLQAQITWLVEPLSFPLVASHPAVDQVICFDKKNWYSGLKKVRQSLKGQQFDLVLDLQRILKSGIFAMLASAPQRLGFDRRRCKDASWLFPFTRIAPADPGRHMVWQYLEFASHLGVQIPTQPSWQIPVKNVLSFSLPEQFVVLNIGATKRANIWTVDGFAGLADLLARNNNISCVLTGGPEDVDMAGAIVRCSEITPLNLAGKTSLSELTTVLNRSAVVVTCDTGPMHLAVALGKEVVALMGPSNPRRTGPFVGHVIQKKLSCLPCNKRKCERRDCMLMITEAEVYREVLTCLSDR